MIRFSDEEYNSLEREEITFEEFSRMITDAVKVHSVDSIDAPTIDGVEFLVEDSLGRIFEVGCNLCDDRDYFMRFDRAEVKNYERS